MLYEVITTGGLNETISMKKNWIALEEVRTKPYAESVALFREFINPGLVDLLEMGERNNFV